MTLEIITEEGISLDLIPRQEIEITLEQPFLNGDKMPVAGSTSIEFPLTPTNKKVFGYWGIPFTGVEHREIRASIHLAGIPIWTGKLTEPEVSDETVSWTFIGASLDPVLEKNLYDLPNLQIESNTPLLYDARKNGRDDVGFPMIIRQAYSANCEHQKGAGTYTATLSNRAITNADCSPMDKYVNYGFVSADHAATPVVKVKWLLDKMLPNVEIDARILPILEKCAILAPHTKTYKRLDESGLYDTIVYCLDLASGLPEVSVAEFLSNLLKMFCASLYYDGSRSRILANATILSGGDAVDWSDKITLPKKSVYNVGQSYKLEYANGETPSEDQDEEEMEVLSAPNIAEILYRLREYQELKNIKRSDSKNLYAGRCFRINPMYTTSFSGANLQQQWSEEPQLDLVVVDCVRYLDIKSKTIAAETSDDEYDASIAFKCVKCVPVRIFKSRSASEFEEIGDGISAIVPIIEMPAADAERTTDVYIGLLEHGQWVSDGAVYEEQSWLDHSAPQNEKAGNFSGESIGNITFHGEDSIWEQFHQTFANWVASPKHSFTSEVNLSLSDLTNLDLSRKVFAYNKNFFIQELRVRLNTSCGLVKSEVDLIER